MHKIIEEIKELLDNKSLTSYRIGKEAGISVQQVDRYRKTAKIENIPLKNALKLQQYYKKLKENKWIFLKKALDFIHFKVYNYKCKEDKQNLNLKEN